MMQITQTQLLAELQSHIGKENGVHVDEMVRRITGQLTDADMHARRVRSLVTELRKQGFQICATPSEGYFVAATAEELDETCTFLYDRAMTTLMQISRMKGIAMPDLRGQLHLPT
ncbi:hypothetical protein [Variovorax gossypii]